MKAAAGGMSRGGRGGGMGGGFPGGGRRRGGIGGGVFYGDSGWGGGGQDSGGGRRMNMPSVQIEGEYWLVDSAFLPYGNKSSLLPVLNQAVNVGPILDELNKQLTKMKLVPLSSKMTLTFSAPNGDSPPPLVTTMEVKAISETPVDDASFKVPDGYKEVKPDAAKQ